MAELSDDARSILEHLVTEGKLTIGTGPIDDLMMGPPYLFIYKLWWFHLIFRPWRPFFFRLSFPTRKKFVQMILNGKEAMWIPAFIQLGGRKW